MLLPNSFENIAYFSDIYYQAPFQDPTLTASNVTNTFQVHMSTSCYY
jgi:hypothetical protein